jgi:hypothetical protein
MMRQPSAAGTGSAASAEFITIDPRRPLEIEFGNIVQAIVERSFAWSTRFRRLVRDYERLPGTLAGLHLVAFACLMVKNLLPILASTH